MKSLKTSTLVGIAAVLVAPAHAYERCQSFKNAELKGMTAEKLEKAYCWNEDRLIEILEVVSSSKSNEAERDRDACWETLIQLSEQPKFERHEKCPGPVQAGASTGRDEIKERKRDLLRKLGIAAEKQVSTK